VSATCPIGRARPSRCWPGTFAARALSLLASCSHTIVGPARGVHVRLASAVAVLRHPSGACHRCRQSARLAPSRPAVGLPHPNGVRYSCRCRDRTEPVSSSASHDRCTCGGAVPRLPVNVRRRRRERRSSASIRSCRRMMAANSRRPDSTCLRLDRHRHTAASVDRLPECMRTRRARAASIMRTSSLLRTYVRWTCCGGVASLAVVVFTTAGIHVSRGVTASSSRTPRAFKKMALHTIPSCLATSRLAMRDSLLQTCRDFISFGCTRRRCREDDIAVRFLSASLPRASIRCTWSLSVWRSPHCMAYGRSPTPRVPYFVCSVNDRYSNHSACIWCGRPLAPFVGVFIIISGSGLQLEVLRDASSPQLWPPSESQRPWTRAGLRAGAREWGRVVHAIVDLGTAPQALFSSRRPGLAGGSPAHGGPSRKRWLLALTY